MTKLYYIAIENGGDIEYIYRASDTPPRIGDTIRRGGKTWIIKGYMPVENGGSDT